GDQGGRAAARGHAPADGRGRRGAGSDGVRLHGAPRGGLRPSGSVHGHLLHGACPVLHARHGLAHRAWHRRGDLHRRERPLGDESLGRADRRGLGRDHHARRSHGRLDRGSGHLLRRAAGGLRPALPPLLGPRAGWRGGALARGGRPRRLRGHRRRSDAGGHRI
ncbi:MAG: Antioxidant, AhpC/Tsa family, partial [uncultured Rubellimicrobium sp.]